jgi:hypothetical protein
LYDIMLFVLKLVNESSELYILFQIQGMIIKC